MIAVVAPAVTATNIIIAASEMNFIVAIRERTIGGTDGVLLKLVTITSILYTGVSL